MPLWRIFAHPDTFSTAQRQALSKDITSIYTKVGLPAFYVNVIFIDSPENSIFIGGEERVNFVRFCVEHIARRLDDAESQKEFMQRAEAVSLLVLRLVGVV